MDAMHVALIGYGEVGRILAEDLRARGHAVTAFDLEAAARRRGVPLRAHARRARRDAGRVARRRRARRRS